MEGGDFPSRDWKNAPIARPCYRLVMFTAEQRERAQEILAVAKRAGATIATAESCTGGLIAGCLTEIAGSSAVFERGWITYSNTAKADELAVPPDLILAQGAVSAEVAQAMAAGALERSGADIAIAVTGVAGPGGGSADKPVGLVWFGLAQRDAEPRTDEKRFGDLGRSEVRLATVTHALALLRCALG